MLETKHEEGVSMTRCELLLRLGKGLAAGAAGGWSEQESSSSARPSCRRAPDREPPPGILVFNILQARRGYGLDKQGKKKAALAVHWSFSTLASAAYGGLAEFFPAATVSYGTVYGWALWAGSHESTLPLLHLTLPLSQVPASEQINEFISHGIFGASVEATRRIVRPLLGK